MRFSSVKHMETHKEKEKADVSVVITSYNQREYLIEAIESVLDQTRQVKEIIVADDGSTDGSADLISDYVRRYPDVVRGVFQKRNVGIPRNRNAALKVVRNKYVFILDGDDRFLPENVEKMVYALAPEENIRCVYGNVRYISPEGHLIGIRDEGAQPSGDILYEIALGKFGILRNMLMDSRLVRAAGLLDERFPKYDGYEMTLRLAQRSRFAYVREPLVEYRVHPTSDSSSLTPDVHLRDLGEIYRQMRTILEGLPASKRRQIDRTWYLKMSALLPQQLLDSGGTLGLFFLPVVASFKRYISLRHLPWAFGVYWRSLLGPVFRSVVSGR